MQQNNLSESSWSCEGFENYPFNNVMHYFLHRKFRYIEIYQRHLRMFYNNVENMIVFVTLAEDVRYVEHCWKQKGRIEYNFNESVTDIYSIEKWNKQR